MLAVPTLVQLDAVPKLSILYIYIYDIFYSVERKEVEVHRREP
jgi:hypothetical protein